MNFWYFIFVFICCILKLKKAGFWPAGIVDYFFSLSATLVALTGLPSLCLLDFDVLRDSKNNKPYGLGKDESEQKSVSEQIRVKHNIYLLNFKYLNLMYLLYRIKAQMSILNYKKRNIFWTQKCFYNIIIQLFSFRTNYKS